MPLGGVRVSAGARIRCGSPKPVQVWCRWARRFADSELLEALLFVASIDTWPVDEAEKVEWQAFAHARGRFSITFPPNAAAAFSLPSLDRILAAALLAKRDGHIGWMRANRVLLRRVGDHSGAGLLAVLMALGGICPAPDWQIPHPTGPGLEALIERLAAERHRTGTLNWESPLGKALREVALATSPSALGWLSRPQLIDMFASLGASPAAAADDADPLKRLLSERDAAVRIARFKSALDDLGANAITAGDGRVWRISAIRALKPHYRTGADTLATDFFEPCLTDAIRYRRAAGYFSSTALVTWAAALPRIVTEHALRIALIASPELSKDDIAVFRELTSETRRAEYRQMLADRLLAEIITLTERPGDEPHPSAHLRLASREPTP